MTVFFKDRLSDVDTTNFGDGSIAELLTMTDGYIRLGRCFFGTLMLLMSLFV